MGQLGLKASGGAPNRMGPPRRLLTMRKVIYPAEEQWVCFRFSAANVMRYLGYELAFEAVKTGHLYGVIPR